MGNFASDQKTSFTKKFSTGLRNLIPDAQVQNPKFAFYHPILTKELKINYQDHRSMRDKKPKKMYLSPDK